MNSTIRQKVGYCGLCSDGVKKPLVKGMCGNHYWQGVRIKSVQKLAEREDVDEDESVKILKADLDDIFSKVVRLSAANKDGNISCFICGKVVRWQDAQNMHYIKRGNSLLRFDFDRNCRAGCRECNEFKGGNYVEYTKQLEKQLPGVTDILMQEANLVYKFSRDELKQMIIEYSTKYKQLKR